MLDTFAMYPGGRLVTNFEEKGAGDTVQFIVPDERRWVILGGRGERDVNATFDVYLRDALGNLILHMHTAGASLVACCWVPGAIGTDERGGLMVADNGMYVEYVWGVAQTSPEVSCLVLEIPLGRQ